MAAMIFTCHKYSLELCWYQILKAKSLGVHLPHTLMREVQSFMLPVSSYNLYKWLTLIRVYHNSIVFQNLVGTIIIAFDAGSWLLHICYHGLTTLPESCRTCTLMALVVVTLVALHTVSFPWHQVTVKHVTGIFHAWFLVLAPVFVTDVTIELLPVCTDTNKHREEVHIRPPIRNFRIVS